jgi:hypothetical protein
MAVEQALQLDAHPFDNACSGSAPTVGTAQPMVAGGWFGFAWP